MADDTPQLDDSVYGLDHPFASELDDAFGTPRMDDSGDDPKSTYFSGRPVVPGVNDSGQPPPQSGVNDEPEDEYAQDPVTGYTPPRPVPVDDPTASMPQPVAGGIPAGTPNAAGATATAAQPPVVQAQPQPEAATRPVYPSRDIATQALLRQKAQALQNPTDRNDPRAKLHFLDYLKAAIVGAALGYGKNITGAVEFGSKVGSSKYNNLEDDRKAKLTQAEGAVKQDDQDYAAKVDTYKNQRTDFQEQQAEKDKQAGVAEHKIELANKEVGKAYQKVDTETGGKSGKWMQRFADGSEKEVAGPEAKPKKIYATPYERSQSDEPDQAAQGRKDYDRSEQRKDDKMPDGDKAASKNLQDKIIKEHGDAKMKIATAMQKDLDALNSPSGSINKSPLDKQQSTKAAIDKGNQKYAQEYDNYARRMKAANLTPDPPEQPHPYPWAGGGKGTTQTQPANSAPVQNAPSAQTATPSKAPSSGDERIYQGARYQFDGKQWNKMKGN